MSPDVLSVIVRAVSFVLLFQATGTVFFAALFSRRLTLSGAGINRLAGGGALLGLVLVIAHLVLEPTRMTGEFAGLLDTSMRRMAWYSTGGASHAMQALGLLLIVVSTRNFSMPIGLAGALCAIGAFLLTGHTSVHPWRAVLAPLLLIHLLIVAFWFGSLLPLWSVAKLETLQSASAVLRKFSALATWLVPVIAGAGVVMTLLIADGIPRLREPYGALIAVKLVGFTVLMLLAAWNKWRLVPAIESGAQSRASLQRSMIAEFVLIIGVLAVTAVMTTFFSPNE